MVCGVGHIAHHCTLKKKKDMENFVAGRMFRGGNENAACTARGRERQEATDAEGATRCGGLADGDASDDIGRFTTMVLNDGKTWKGKNLKIVSESLSMEKIAEIFERVTGIKATYDPFSLTEYRALPLPERPALSGMFGLICRVRLRSRHDNASKTQSCNGYLRRVAQSEQLEGEKWVKSEKITLSQLSRSATVASVGRRSRRVRLERGNVPQVIASPGDVILKPNPCCPIYSFGFLMAGGVIRSIPIQPRSSFFRLSLEIARSVPKLIAVISSYPSNPHGAKSRVWNLQRTGAICSRA